MPPILLFHNHQLQMFYLFKLLHRFLLNNSAVFINGRKTFLTSRNGNIATSPFIRTVLTYRVPLERDCSWLFYPSKNCRLCSQGQGLIFVILCGCPTESALNNMINYVVHFLVIFTRFFYRLFIRYVQISH